MALPSLPLTPKSSPRPPLRNGVELELLEPSVEIDQISCQRHLESFQVAFQLGGKLLEDLVGSVRRAGVSFLHTPLQRSQPIVELDGKIEGVLVAAVLDLVEFLLNPGQSFQKTIGQPLQFSIGSGVQALLQFGPDLADLDHCLVGRLGPVPDPAGQFELLLKIRQGDSLQPGIHVDPQRPGLALTQGRDYARISQGRDLTRHHYNYYHPDFHPFWEGSRLHSLQSVTKSVNSALIGIALARGRLPGLEVKVLPYFSDYKIQRMDDRKRRMTLLNLVTMRAGLYWNVVDYPLPDPRNTTIQLESSEDWIQFCLDQPMASEPGEVFVYSSGAAQLLSGLIKQATGLHVPEYAEAHLFNPIGIHRYHWKRDPESFADTEGGLYLTAEDLARFGYLFLRGGIWDGKRILAEGWVTESTSRKTEDVAPGDPEQNRGYGYQWWRLEEPGDTPVVAGLGYGGQYLLIIPERDLVAVMTGWNIFEPYPSALTPFLRALLSSTTP